MTVEIDDHASTPEIRRPSQGDRGVVEIADGREHIGGRRIGPDDRDRSMSSRRTTRSRVDDVRHEFVTHENGSTSEASRGQPARRERDPSYRRFVVVGTTGILEVHDQGIGRHPTEIASSIDGDTDVCARRCALDGTIDDPTLGECIQVETGHVAETYGFTIIDAKNRLLHLMPSPLVLLRSRNPPAESCTSMQISHDSGRQRICAIGSLCPVDCFEKNSAEIR